MPYTPRRKGARHAPLLLALLGLLVACGDKGEPVEEPGGDDGAEPAPVTEVAVGAGQIFAGDFEPTTLTWWVVDATSGAIVSTGTQAGGAITVTLTDAAGAYVTTPSYTADPGYTIQLEGSVAAGGLFSYLDTDVPAFVGLRGSDGANMASKHAEMVSQAATLVATFQTDLDDAKADMATAVYDEVSRARDHMGAGGLLLHDTDDVDAIAAGSAGMAPFVAECEGYTTTLQAESDADVAIAEGTALSIATLTPDDAAIQSAVEACLDLTAQADKLDATLGSLLAKPLLDETWEFDGRNKLDSGEMDDRTWIELEASLAKIGDEAEGLSAELEACVLNAIGGEPTLITDDITPDPYIALGDAATAMAEATETSALAYEATLTADYSDYIDLDTQTGTLSPSTWAVSHTHATTLLTAMIGADLLADDDEILVADSDDEVMAVEDSSFTACEVPTGSFQINLAGLAVAIGTPFDDVIRGADVDTGFEVIVGLWGDDCLNGLKGHELILGGRGDDELHGGDQHEIIFGGGGDDTIFAGEGATYDITLPTTPPSQLSIDIGSLVFGGDGDDAVSGADPDFDEEDDSAFGYTDFLFGDFVSADKSGNDSLEGGAGVDFLFGQWGDDALRNRRPGHFVLAIEGTDEIPATTEDFEFGSFHFGGSGDDMMVASSSFDLLFGAKDDDDASGEEGIDLVFGGKGDDEVKGGDGFDLVFGGRGSDFAEGGDGPDLVFGNSGEDIVTGDGGLADLLFGGSDNDEVSGGDGLDMAFGGSGQDMVSGDAGIDLVFGNSDNDDVLGGGGIDLVFGNTGSDWTEGGSGLDLMFGNDEIDVVIGNEGVDVMFGNDGADWMSGESGVDLIWSNDQADAIWGGSEIDVLFGNDDDDCVWGNDGVDLAFGGEGADDVRGGNELDLIVGGEGNDILAGESGPDIVTGNDGADAINGGDGVDLIWGGSSEDLIYGGSSLDLVFGGSGEDCVDGEDGFDLLFGGDDDDTLQDASVAFGNDGNDSLSTTLAAFGGKGDDEALTTGSGAGVLLGNDGADHLYLSTTAGLSALFGNEGEDVLTAAGSTVVGGTEARTFLFGGKDGDWIQASKGRSVAFGNDGDDTMSGDPDGSSTNDDLRDWLFGNRDADLLAGDGSNKTDLLLRGAGNDPSREWDSLPSTASGWTSTHSAPNVGVCDVAPVTDCDDQKEPPPKVGVQ